MPEINVRNNNINRTADDNLIMLAKNIARAYHEIGVLTEREYNRTRRTNDLNVINDIISDIPNMEMGQRLKFCKSFVANDTENFNNATPAILAYAYMATRGEDTPMAHALAARIDDMSANFAQNGALTKNDEKSISVIADLYSGFKLALESRISDLDTTRDAGKIAQMKSNIAQLDETINGYDNTWGLNKLRTEDAEKLNARWDALNSILAKTRLNAENKQELAKIKFLDAENNEINQFLDDGEMDPQGRAAALLELVRGDVARSHVARVDENINAEELDLQLNAQFMTQLRNAAKEGVISDKDYNDVLEENANAVAGWVARLKTKLGMAAGKVRGFFGRVFRKNEDVDRLSNVRMATEMVSARQRRLQLLKRILAGMLSGLVASALITTIVTAVAATAGVSRAASAAMIGVTTAIGIGVVQVVRWRRRQAAAGLPTDLRAFLADARLLSSLGVSVFAIAAMLFGAGGMTATAMYLGYGTLGAGGIKNGVEAFIDARKSYRDDGRRMSILEAAAWGVGSTLAVIGGGVAGRYLANLGIDAYNNARPQNTEFQNPKTQSEAYDTTREVEHSRTVTDYPSDAIPRAEARVQAWYQDNPDLLQQRVDAINQYNLEHGTDINPYRALNVIGLAGEQTPDNMMLHVNNGGAVPSHGHHGGYTGAKWQNTYGYTPEQIDLVAHTFNPDGTINPEGMEIVRQLDLNNLGSGGTVGVVDGARGAHTDGVLPQNDIARGAEASFNGRVHSVYSPTGELPTQHTETWTETQTETAYRDVTDYTRAQGDGMAAFGNYNPRDRRTTLRDRIGTFWNRVKDNRRDEPKPIEQIEPLDEKHDNSFIPAIIEKTEEKPVVKPVFEDKPMDEVITDEVIVEDTPKTPAPEKIDVNFEDVFTPTVDIDEVEHRPADKEKNPFDLPIVTPVVEQEPVDDLSVVKPVLEDEREPVFVDDKILALTRPQAKAWYDLNARLDKVRKKLDKSPHGSKAAKLRAEESKLKYYIANLCNKIGHNDYEAIERAAREALLREDLNQKAELINAGPGENATKWDVVDWRGEIAKLDKSIDKKIEEFGADTMENARAEESRLYFPAPVPGVQRQKKDARGYVKLPSENELYPHAEEIVVEEPIAPTEPENAPHKTTKAERRAARRAEKQERKDARRKFIASLPQKIERFKLYEVLRRAEQKKEKNVSPNREYDVPDSLRKLATNATIVDEPITKMRGVPVYLVDIGGNKNPITQNRERPMVVVQVGEKSDGVENSESTEILDSIRIPFYLATGLEEYSSRPTGHWYPLTVLMSDGRMYTDNKYDIPELESIAAALDAHIGDIRNWRDNVLTQERAALGLEGFVGGSDVMQHLDPMIVKNTFDESVYDGQGLYSHDTDHASLADDRMANALANIRSVDRVEQKRRLGDGIRNIGRRALNRFGFGYDDSDYENER